MHLACQNNEVETVEILINKGVDLNCLNSVRINRLALFSHSFVHDTDPIRSDSVAEITVTDSHCRGNGTHGYLRALAGGRCEYRATGTGKPTILLSAFRSLALFHLSFNNVSLRYLYKVVWNFQLELLSHPRLSRPRWSSLKLHLLFVK